MSEYKTANVTAISRRAVGALVILPVLLAVNSIAGWVLEIPSLKNPFLDQPPVAPSTAVCLLLASAALVSFVNRASIGNEHGERVRRADTAVLVFGLLGLMTAGLILLNYCVPGAPDFDQIFKAAKFEARGYSPGRMAPNSAFAFVLVFLSVLFARGNRTMRRISHAITLVLSVLVGVTLLGYLYAEPQLYAFTVFTPMALPTACALMAIACALFASLPEIGLMRILSGTTEGAYSTRRLFMAAVILPVLLGYLRMTGERLHLYNPAFGVALMAVCMIVLFSLIIFRTAAFTDRFAAEREKSLSTIRALNVDLGRMRDKAVEAVRIKSEFLANMSHEIRTPMNAVIGCADILKRTRLDAEQARLLEIITTSGHALLEVINDILLLSKIEAGRYEAEAVVFDLNSLVDDCTSIFAPKIREKGLGFRVISPATLPTVYSGDPQGLRQVITNLLSNAIKFTKYGSVTLTIEGTELDGDTVELKISVTDTGIGIQPANVAKLFSAFTQADGSITREFGGTGLGLAISKRLIELMGGTIWVESTPGIGSTFAFSLALQKSEASELTGASDARKAEKVLKIDDFTSALPEDANKSVLLVEDNPVNQEVARYELRALGFDCVVCSNGQEALNILAQRRFPLVLMDCQMPVMDGYEAVSLLRERERQKSSVLHTPVIAMTANAMEGDAEKCISAGMDDYISKPVTIPMLKSVIEKWFLVGMETDNGDAGSGNVTPFVVPTIDASLQQILLPLKQAFGEEDAFRFIQMFIKQTPEMLDQIQMAIDQHDSRHIMINAHNLRGSAATLGFHDIAKLAGVIESKSDDFIICTNELAKLRARFTDLNALLQEASVSNIEAIAINKTKLIVVEDNELTREAIVCLVSQIKDFEVIGDCGNGATAVDLVLEKKPDVVLFDIELPGMNGIQALARVKAQAPGIKALMLTSHDNDSELFNAFGAGADGYLLKHSFNKRNFELAIQTVLGGACWLDPELARRVLQVAAGAKHAQQPHLSVLSSEEEERLETIAENSCPDGVCSIDSAFLRRLKKLHTGG